MSGHVPVLAREVAALVRADAAGAVLDATFGAGGHARLLLERAPRIALIAADRDAAAVDNARALAAEVQPRRIVLPVHMRFSEIRRRLRALRPAPVARLAGALLDLGVSSMQLDQAPRGFAFRLDGPLDMRMDQTDTTAPSAADLVNTLDHGALADGIRRYGEERQAGRIARAIVEWRRRHGPLTTTAQLADLVHSVVPASDGDGADDVERHPATRTFQALRIMVNDELTELEQGLRDIETMLEPGGFLIVLSYHSLEDRIVKRLMLGDAERRRAGTGTFEPMFKGVVTRSPAEVAANPRARSAKLRAALRTSAPVQHA